MYKQFISYTSINTSERKYLKYNNKKIYSNILFNNILYKSKENKWKKYYKKSKYFSIVPLLISNKTSADYYTNSKCCIDFYLYKKKHNLKNKKPLLYKTLL